MKSNSFIVLDGAELAFNDLVNQAFLEPKYTKSLTERFVTNSPFPHIVLDGLFSPILLNQLYAEFDEMRWRDWRWAESEVETKRGSLPGSRLGMASQLYFQAIYSSQFMSLIKKISGIERLISDPELINGGMHEIPTGGFFNVHRDFTHHPILRLQNRLALITYLNKDWDMSYGGQLELWDKDLKGSEVSVIPEFGKTILFLNTTTSFHGHPLPVQAPNGRPRRSVTAYYYSSYENKGESVAATVSQYVGSTTSSFRRNAAIRQFVPPIMISIGRKLEATLLKRKTK